MPIVIEAIGRVEPIASVTVRPRVDGQLQERHFAEGEFVEAGAPLFSIDPRPYRSALDQAEAEFREKQALARDAQNEARRVEDLLSRGAAGSRERDSTQAAAEAQSAAAEAARAAVTTARLRLEFCTIRAPLSGRAGAALIDAGSIVRENETDLVVINQVDPTYVAFNVAEQDLPRVRQAMGGQPLAVDIERLEANTDSLRGELAFIDNTVDVSTGTVRLRARVPNPAGLLWPGQYVGVRLILSLQPGSVLVPTAAVQMSQQGEYAFRIGPEDTAEFVLVKTGAARGGQTAILEGLAAGDRVVTDGHLQLRPGSRVTIADAAPASAPVASGDGP